MMVFRYKLNGSLILQASRTFFMQKCIQFMIMIAVSRYMTPSTSELSRLSGNADLDYN